MNDDLLAAKEANERAPTKTMKALVERLRNQLALKEKQQKVIYHKAFYQLLVHFHQAKRQSPEIP